MIPNEYEEEVKVESVNKEQEDNKPTESPPKLALSPSFKSIVEKEKQEDERSLLELRAYKLRKYLIKNVIPFLGEALVEVCKTRPDNAIEYLVSLNKKLVRVPNV